MGNNNIMPKISESDLIKCFNKIYDVKIVDKELIKEICGIETGDITTNLLNTLYYDYYNSDDGNWVCIQAVEDILEDITAIYRKSGKDYVCIWEENKTNSGIEASNIDYFRLKENKND